VIIGNSGPRFFDADSMNLIDEMVCTRDSGLVASESGFKDHGENLRSGGESNGVEAFLFLWLSGHAALTEAKLSEDSKDAVWDIFAGDWWGRLR
jgi:hypothetical protein